MHIRRTSPVHIFRMFAAIALIWLASHSCPAKNPRTPQSGQQDIQNPVFDPDSGSGLSFIEDRPRIDDFARKLKKMADAKGYIIAYGGVVGPAGEARARLDCIRTRLQNTHNISPSRLVLIDGGHRMEVSVELFLIRPGDPKPEPFETVRAETVRIVKRKKEKCPSGLPSDVRVIKARKNCFR
jgi:hypothetical protein